MTEQQLKVIIGLMTGMQTALVHMSNVLADHAQINREELAASFEATAEAIPAEVENRRMIQIPLQQVAAGIRSSAAGPEWEQLISRLLH